MAGRSAQEIACYLFKKHYKNLSSGLQAHLPMLVGNLYSEFLVSSDNKAKALDNTTSQLEKCMCLLNDVEDRIRRDYSVFEKFCAVLCSQEVGLFHLGDPMLRDFQQLCPKPTIHGSYIYNTPNESPSKFTEPAPESQRDITDEGTSNTSCIQLSRSDKHGIGDDDGGEKAVSYLTSFGTPQQALDTVSDPPFSGQVVPEKETGRPERANTVAPYIGLVDYDTNCYAVKHSVQGSDSEEDRLVCNLRLSWDRIKLKCENCASIHAEYERKLIDMKEFYDERLKHNVPVTKSAKHNVPVTKSASFRDMERLKYDKHCLQRVVQMQSVLSDEDCRKLEGQLKEKEQEIEKLERQVEQQMSELMGMQNLLERKKKEQEDLKSALSLKERDLHKMIKSARCCPVYSNEKRRAHFERKRELCEEIQSLVARFFATLNLDDRSKLHDKIQAKFAHFTSLKRRRSFSL